MWRSSKLNGSRPARSASADSHKHSDRSPLQRSVPAPALRQSAPPGPVWSESQVAARLPRLRDFHPPHGLWCIRLGSKFIPDALQPFLQPCRLDSREALAIHSRRALIGLCQCICMVQDVLPVDLVVEKIETVVRLFLRFLVQLPLKHPDLNRCLQAHRQSPLLSFFKSTSEVRVLPSAGITRHPRSYDPLRLPVRPSPYR